MKALILAFDPNRPRRQVMTAHNLSETDYDDAVLALADQLQQLAGLDPDAFLGARLWVEQRLRKHGAKGGA